MAETLLSLWRPGQGDKAEAPGAGVAIWDRIISHTRRVMHMAI